jgi:hypothetical protein
VQGGLIMYILYDETFWTDEKGNRRHDCVKTKFETLEGAKAEMKHQFELRSPDNNGSTLLLNRSALIIQYDQDRYYRMIQFGIAEEA